MHAQNELKYFVVEGNIGAGKSTFFQVVNKYINAQLVFEPLDRWQNISGENLLQKFYKDTPRWAYTFQTYAFITRILEQEQRAKKNTKPFQVLERSVYSDRYCFAYNCYEMGLMSSLEWKLYQEWFSWLVDTYMQKPSGFIYLRTNPEVCYERLKKRNRSEESEVSLEYLKRVHEKHESWLIDKQGIDDHIKNLPVLVLECNEDFENNIEIQQAHIAKIIQFLELEYAIPANVSALTYNQL